MNLIDESEILLAKNVSSSPMVFATKILYKIFDLSELIGHNVSGKTFNKFIKHKKALDEKRINYIKWLVENHFDAQNKEDLWKSCRTAINKSIRNNELKGLSSGSAHTNKSANNTTTIANTASSATTATVKKLNAVDSSASKPILTETAIKKAANVINLQPNMSIFQITNEEPPLLDVVVEPTETGALDLDREFIPSQNKSLTGLSKLSLPIKAGSYNIK